MKDDRLLNGYSRCTLIESFRGLAIVIGPDRTKTIHDSVEDAVRFIEDNCWSINIDHIHGPSIRRDHAEGIPHQ